MNKKTMATSPVGIDDVQGGLYLKRVIHEGLNPYLKDNVNAWELDADGGYQRRKPCGRQPRFCAQQFLALALGTPREEK